jgi:hypothetical protein
VPLSRPRADTDPADLRPPGQSSRARIGPSSFGRAHADASAFARARAASTIILRAGADDGVFARPWSDWKTAPAFSTLPSGEGELLMGSSGLPLPGSGTFYLGAVGDQNRAEVELPGSEGQLSRFAVRVGQAPGVGNSWTYTVLVNGVATAMSCTISGTSRRARYGGQAIDLTDDDDFVVERTATVGGAAPPATTHNWSALYSPS